MSEPVEDGLLLEAHEIARGARELEYGHPRDNFERIAKLWTAYLQSKYASVFIELEASDVGWLNILQKCSRDIEAKKRDNLVDVAGYADAMQRARA